MQLIQGDGETSTLNGLGVSTTVNFTPMEPDVNYLNMFLTDLAITNVLAMAVLTMLGQPLIQF